MLTPVLTLEARAIVVTFDGAEVLRWSAPPHETDAAAWLAARVDGLTWSPDGAPRAFVYSAATQAFEQEA